MDEGYTRRVNRRLAARLACRLTVRYKGGSDWRPATAMDLSPKGCRLRVGEDLPHGTRLELAFDALIRDGTTRPSVEVPGTITWSRLEGLSHQIGVTFDTPEEGFRNLLAALR